MGGYRRLFEIGCSTGFFLREALQLGIPEVTGFEPSRDCYDHADPAVKGSIIDDVFDPARIREHAFDVACSFHVIDHLTAPMGCVDCHDPHAASDRRRLGGFKESACMRCHTEYRGPWVFEHEVVAVEGCVACHTPHGSVNRHLLAYQRVGDLCLQCHPEQPFFHVVTDGEGQRTTGINDCTRCHTEIHGSNNDALFLN